MKTTARFENAINKLYEAFNNNTLNPECCKQCAVGNILDNTDSWKHLSDFHGSTQLNYLGRVNQFMGKKFNGYTPEELLKIEITFLKTCGFTLPLHHKNPTPQNLNDNILFDGLCEVIKLLCDLDEISNILDYKKRFRESLDNKTAALIC